MLSICDLWWLVGVIVCCMGVINPYVGLFSLFTIVGVFVLICFYINIIVRVREKSHSKDKREKIVLANSNKALCIGWSVISVIVVLVSTVIEALIWYSASGHVKNVVRMMTPVDLFPQESRYMASILIFVISVLLKIVMVVMVFACSSKYRNENLQIKQSQAMEQYQYVEAKYAGWNMLCIGVCVAGALVGVLCSQDRVLVIYEMIGPAWMLIGLGIYEIVHDIFRKAYQSENVVFSGRGKRMLYGMSAGHSWNYFMIAHSVIWGMISLIILQSQNEGNMVISVMELIAVCAFIVRYRKQK